MVFMRVWHVVDKWHSLNGWSHFPCCESKSHGWPGLLPDTTYPVIHCHLDAETGWCHISRMSFCCSSPALHKPQKDASEMCLEGVAHLNKEGESSSHSDEVLFVSSWNKSILLEDGEADAKGEHEAMWHLKSRECSKNKSQVLSTGHEGWALGELWVCPWDAFKVWKPEQRTKETHETNACAQTILLYSWQKECRLILRYCLKCFCTHLKILGMTFTTNLRDKGSSLLLKFCEKRDLNIIIANLGNIQGLQWSRRGQLGMGVLRKLSQQ